MLAPLLLLLAAQMPDTFVVTGTMVDHSQNRPLKYILVTLTSTKDQRLTVSAITAADGRFGFNNVPAGKYTLSAQRRGNGRQQLYRQNDQYSTAIAVGPGLASQNIVFPLEAPGSISGTVLDQNGEAATGQIWLFRETISGGKSAIVMSGQHPIDRSGAFHAGHLSPGTYCIAASAQPWYARPYPQLAGNPNPELDVAYPITYYGDTADPSAAAPVHLAEGASATVQINLRAVPAVHVDLGAVATEHRQPSPMLMAETLGGYTIPANSRMLGVNGRQELNVAPGHYILRRTDFSGDSGRAAPGARIDVAGNISIAASDLKATSLSGTLTFEGSAPAAGAALLQFSCAGRRYSVRVLKDGSLRTGDEFLQTGRCDVALANAPGYYLKSIAVRDAKPSTDTVDLVDGVDNRITAVAVKGAVSELTGVAVQNEQPFAGAMLLLLPEDLSRGALIRRDQSDSDGSFTLSEILPGRYTLLAIDNGKDLPYRDPAVIQRYVAHGTPLEFPTSNSVPVKVNIQSSEH